MEDWSAQLENQLCSGKPTAVKDQPRESGTVSRTIIGDFAPKPDSGSIR